MDWQSVAIAALGGGIGGGVGALLGFGLGRLLPQRVRRIGETACAVALAIAGAKFAPLIAGPPRTTDVASIESQLLADPGFGPMAQAWRESDAASFNAFATQLGAASDRASAIEQGRAAMQAAAMPRLAHLDDAHLVEMIRMSRDQILELQARHPIACHPLFHNRGFGDISPYLSERVRARELALATAAFRADPNTPRPALEGPALTSAIERLVQTTRADFGGDIVLLAPDANVEGREARACAAIAALYDHMQQLPPDQAAALMRGLLALRAPP